MVVIASHNSNSVADAHAESAAEATPDATRRVERSSPDTDVFNNDHCIRSVRSVVASMRSVAHSKPLLLGNDMSALWLGRFFFKYFYTILMRLTSLQKASDKHDRSLVQSSNNFVWGAYQLLHARGAFQRTTRSRKIVRVKWPTSKRCIMHVCNVARDAVSPAYLPTPQVLLAS